MNNDINYKKVLNLFNYYIKIVVANNLKPRNLGTDQIPFLNKFIEQIPFKTEGYLSIEPCEKENTTNKRFHLFFTHNGRKQRLNISAFDDDCLAESTIRQKLEFLFYIGLIEWYSTTKSISDSDKWKRKIYLQWDQISQSQYNGLNLFFLTLKNETKTRKKMGQNSKSMAFSFLLNCFLALLQESDNEVISLIQKQDERFFDNVSLRGSKKAMEKSIQLFLFVNDNKNNYPKVYKQFLDQYGKNHFFELMMTLVASLDSKLSFDASELNQEISYKQEADKIIQDINTTNLRSQQNVWKHVAIGIRKIQGRTKDDIGKYGLFNTHKVEAAHIISVSQMKAKIMQCYKNQEYKKVCQLHQDLYSQQNILILPVEVHRDLDHKYIKIYADGSIYNSQKQLLPDKLKYIPHNSFLLPNPHKTT